MTSTLECKFCCNYITEKNFILHQIQCEKQHQGFELLDMQKQVILQPKSAPIEIKSLNDIMNSIIEDPDLTMAEKEQPTISASSRVSAQNLYTADLQCPSKKLKFEEQYCDDFDTTWDCQKCSLNNLNINVYCQGCGQLCIQEDNSHDDIVRSPIPPILTRLNDW